MLSAKNINKSYDGVHALVDASFDLRVGEIHALMGENGAGKSTLGRVLAGAASPDSGEILLEGRRYVFSDPQDAQKAGVGIIHQELDLFPDLTIGENIVIGNLQFQERWRVSRARIEAFCRPVLLQVGLNCPSETPASKLSVAQQQLLLLARALSMKVRALIMDEPTSALPEDAVDRLFGLIKSLRGEGVSIVYVSHKMEEICRISDRVTVLRDGQTIGTLETAATSPDQLIRMMVGRAIAATACRSPTRKAAPTLLSASRLNTRKLRDVSFDLQAGEILGVAGLVGAGRSALGAALFGLDRLVSGTMALRGQSFAPKSAAEALKKGVSLLPGDRKTQGLMMQMSVRENGSLAALRRLSRGGFIQRAQERALMNEWARRLRLKSASHEIPVSALSGGNQQKTLLARIMLTDPDVLFLDDPARGIDVGAKADIYALIEEWADRGKGIILVSSELPELLRLTDRIMVLSEGSLSDIFRTDETDSEQIMAAAMNVMAA